MNKKSNPAKGSLKINSGVIEKIAELAAMEIKGVASDGQHLETRENPLLIANRFISPISVKLSNETANIDIALIVIQGNKAVKVAEAVQHSVKSAVQNMTGIAVSKINVKIAGVKPEASA